MTSLWARWGLKSPASRLFTQRFQRKHQSSASLAFVWGIHRWPVKSPHKWPVARKMFPFDDVVMYWPFVRECSNEKLYCVIDFILKNLLNKQPSCCWFEAPGRSHVVNVMVLTDATHVGTDKGNSATPYFTVLHWKSIGPRQATDTGFVFSWTVHWKQRYNSQAKHATLSSIRIMLIHG